MGVWLPYGVQYYQRGGGEEGEEGGQRYGRGDFERAFVH